MINNGLNEMKTSVLSVRRLCEMSLTHEQPMQFPYLINKRFPEGTGRHNKTQNEKIQNDCDDTDDSSSCHRCLFVYY